MTEDEYWEEFDEDDFGEFGDIFLSSDQSDDDINIVAIPKLEYDLEEFIMGYVKTLKKCKTTDEAMSVMYDFYAQVKLITTIENEQEDLQNRVQVLEMLMEQVSIR